MKKHFTIHLMAKLAIAGGLIAMAPGIGFAQECTALKGTYAFTFSGSAIFPGATVPTTFNGVGMQTFNDSGKWTGTESANFGAFVLRSAPISGSYTLNPDCTGTMTATFPDGSSGLSDFVVAEGGKTIYAIGVKTGGTTAITYTKLR